jgi:hypothetical protein
MVSFDSYVRITVFVAIVLLQNFGPRIALGGVAFILLANQSLVGT